MRSKNIFVMFLRIEKHLYRFMQKLHPVIIDNAAESFTNFDSEHPMILLKHDHFTELIIRHYH